MTLAEYHVKERCLGSVWPQFKRVHCLPPKALLNFIRDLGFEEVLAHTTMSGRAGIMSVMRERILGSLWPQFECVHARSHF